MGNREFDRFVERAAISGPTVHIDWEEKKQQWLDALDNLYDKIQDFLRPYIDSNKVELVFRKVEIDEELIGTYQAKAATLMIGSNRIELRPIGTNLIAAKGRVDMNGPLGTIKLVLVPASATGPAIQITVSTSGQPSPRPSSPAPAEVIEWEWKIATPAPRIRYLPLNQDAFFDAVMSITSESEIESQ